MTNRDWRRLAHIREQQERMARLNLAAAAGKLREALHIQDAFREQAAASEQCWRQLLAGTMQASHWAAMAGAGRIQHDDLRAAERNALMARTHMEHFGQLHRDTVIDQEMAETLVERQLAEERRKAWIKLQNVIDEHTAASRSHEREPDARDQHA